MTSSPVPSTGSHPIPFGRPDRGVPAPNWLTRAGQADVRAEQQHALAVRSTVRAVELARVRIAGQHAVDLAEMQAASARLTERKLLLDQQHRMSKALGGDDPELRAKFAVMDDDNFHAQRAEEMRRPFGGTPWSG